MGSVHSKISDRAISRSRGWQLFGHGACFARLIGPASGISLYAPLLVLYATANRVANLA